MHQAKSAFKKTFFLSRGLIFVLLISGFLCSPLVSQASQTKTTDPTLSAAEASKITAANKKEPQISIVSPKGGQSFTAGQKMTIRWNQTNVDNITIGLKTKSGLMEWIEFDYKVNINSKTGSYDWTIPVINNTVENLQIELTAYHTGVGSKTTDSGPFTIKGIPNANQTGGAATLSQNQKNIINLLSPVDWSKVLEEQTESNQTIAPGTPLTSADAYKAVVKVKTFTLKLVNGCGPCLSPVFR